jgi:hypothetical protein
MAHCRHQDLKVYLDLRLKRDETMACIDMVFALAKFKDASLIQLAYFERRRIHYGATACEQTAQGGLEAMKIDAITIRRTRDSRICPSRDM